jgi:hypothetical protein
MQKIFFILLLMSSLIGSAQTIATFEVNLPHLANGLEVPVSTSLKDIKSLPAADSMMLMVVDGERMVAIPFQVTDDKNKTLSWLVKQWNNQKKIVYHLIKKMPPSKIFEGITPKAFTEITTTDKDGAYIISDGDKNLLSYVHKKVYPPAGIDTAYGKSGFIHPLWTPHGQVLTRIQPKDHYHHYGIWNPWTHVLFEADTVDFWNIGDKKGTVRFAKLLSETSGAVFSEFKVLHEHVVFKKGDGEKIALNEIQTVRVYKPEEGSNYYIMDFTSEMSCASQSPFHIVAYRYAGFGWRATEFWTKDNSEMLTSEGKTRDSTDGTKGRWIIVYGELPENEQGGAAMLSYPGNYNHPEPLRIWDKKANGGRGDVFANFAPTKDKDWILEPGKTYTLKYRMVVFNGKFDAAKAESAWQYFAKPAEVKIVK